MTTGILLITGAAAYASLIDRLEGNQALYATYTSKGNNKPQTKRVADATEFDRLTAAAVIGDIAGLAFEAWPSYMPTVVTHTYA